MKTLPIFAVLVIFISIFSVGCSKPTDNPATSDSGVTSPAPQATEAVVQSAAAKSDSLSGRWQLSWDMSRDGQFHAEGGFPIELVEDAGKLSGHASAEAPPDEKASLFDGSVRREGRTMVELRQLKGGYIGTINAELVEPRRITGTWTDNEGHAGEVELIRQ